MSTNKFLSLGLVLTKTINRLPPSHVKTRLESFSKTQVKTLVTLRTMGCRTSKVDISKRNESCANTSEADYVEDVVCAESDIAENQMKVFDLKDAGKVLVVRQKGKIHAIGNRCTHYGAHLVNGALGDGRIRCQWHGACFNIETGDIEDFPGFDSLPCHKVTIENGNVKVRAKRSELKAMKRVKPMSMKSSTDNRHFVVIGGGPAAAICVETLRQENFAGGITFICKENHLPYDRVKITKLGDFDIVKNQFRTLEFYRNHGIDVVLGEAADKVDTKSKEVRLENGRVLKYDKLFIATGQYAAKRDTTGQDLKNVFTLRKFEDGKQLISELGPDKEVIVNGSSFIAMEAAAMCLDKAKSVTLVHRAKIPFDKTLGETIGSAFKKLFETKGVKFKNDCSLKSINDDGTGKVKSVDLTDGTTLKADVVVLGLGSKPHTDFLEYSGIDVGQNGSVEVDEYLKTNVEDVFAGGDIAFAPVFAIDNKKATIGHFPLAHYHGKIAALNMLGQNKPLRAVPYFWSTLFGKSIRYTGHGNAEEIIFVGDVDEMKFVAFYLDKKEQVIAVCSCAMDPVVSQFAELLFQGKKLFKKDLEGSDKLSWVTRILPE